MTLKEELIAMRSEVGLDSLSATPVTGKEEQPVPAKDANDELAQARDKVAQKNALNSKVANPLKTSISYKGKNDEWNAPYFYEVKTRYGSLELHNTQPDPRDGIRGCGTSASEELKNFIASFPPQQPVQITEGKFQGRWKLPYSITPYRSKEDALRSAQTDIHYAIEEYLKNEALRVYAEQNKSDISFNCATTAQHYEQRKQEEVERLKKMGIIVDAKGNFRKAPQNTATTRTTATTRSAPQTQR